MKELEFYDVKSKEKFKSTEYEVREKTTTNENTGNTTTRYFAVTKSPTGTHECWKVLSKAVAEELKQQKE